MKLDSAKLQEFLGRNSQLSLKTVVGSKMPKAFHTSWGDDDINVNIFVAAGNGTLGHAAVAVMMQARVNL